MSVQCNLPPGVVRPVHAGFVALLCLICLSCGQNYRPVATPVNPIPPNSNFNHFMLVVDGNGGASAGSTTTFDVSGDTAALQTNTGILPTYATLMNSGTLVYVSNSGDGTVTSYGATNGGSFTTTVLPTGAVPVFFASTESSRLYVADVGLDSVHVISTITNAVTNSVSLPGAPVSLAELPNGTRVYSANRGIGGGLGSVSSINTIDDSVNLPIVGANWNDPVWVLARADNQRVFVLDKGAGSVVEINTSGAVDTIQGNVAVGAGADYMVFDSRLSRLYVTNPVGGTVSVLDASDITGTISLLQSIAVPGALSVAALPDTTRFYVTAAAVSAGTISSSVAVFSASGYALQKTIALASVPQNCTASMNSPFDLSIAASADSSRVYVGNCDAGNTAIIATVPDTYQGDSYPEDSLVASIPSPASTQPALTFNISAATLEGSNTVYTYSPIDGAVLKVGMTVTISGMLDPGNNGTFLVAAISGGTFTVANPAGVTATSQAGIGLVPVPQNPVFVIAGP